MQENDLNTMKMLSLSAEEPPVRRMDDEFDLIGCDFWGVYVGGAPAQDEAQSLQGDSLSV